MAKVEEIIENVEQKSDGSVVVEVTKQQMDKILHPEGFKKANELTEVDDLKFQMGRLRTHLVTWQTFVEYEGKLYLVLVDPLNKMVKFLGHGSEPDEEGRKVIDEFNKNNLAAQEAISKHE